MAWGWPSEAHGPWYRHLDGSRIARLPGPPFLFVSRLVDLAVELGVLRPGSELTAEYDIPKEAWYFQQNCAQKMPFVALLESVLQPCGILSWLTGVRPYAPFDTSRVYRNLDGTMTLYADVTPQSGSLRTRARLLSSPLIGNLHLFKFVLDCRIGETRIAAAQSDFGFFPPEAMATQSGLPTTGEDRVRLHAASEFQVDLTTRPPKYFSKALRLPEPMLLMLQRVTGFWPQGGSAGLGYLRAEKSIDPGEWYFKAHFFQDPVQPGSLGLEGLCQLLEFYVIETGLGTGIKNPQFQCPMHGRELSWKYRGQALPENRLVRSELEITELGRDEIGPFAVAQGWLWVDDLRVYHMKNLGIRVVSAG